MRQDLQNNMNFKALNDVKTIYMGSPLISKIVLEGLLEAGLNVIAVISNEDKPTGRKAILTPTPVKEFALSKGIPVYTPHRIRKEHEFLKEIPCDLILTMAYGQIVPQEVLDHPRIACLNLHGSLLPALRGAAPIQRALDLGLEKTGVTLMEMVDKMDAGRMFDKEEILLGEDENYTSLSLKIASASIALTKRSLLDVLNGVNPGEEQDESLVTFADKILPEDEKLDFGFTRAQFVNRVKAISLTPGAYCYLGNDKLKILASRSGEEGRYGQNGQVIDCKKKLTVQVADGLVEILSVLPAGKKQMDARSFCNGRDLQDVILH